MLLCIPYIDITAFIGTYIQGMIIHTCIYIYMCVCVCVCVHAYFNTRNTYMYMYVCMYVCIRIFHSSLNHTFLN